MDTIKEIKNIQFGVLSSDEIKKISVCKVDNTKKSGSGSVYDPKMGVHSTGSTCETCYKDASKCTGHPGHIELQQKIINPLYYRQVFNILNCICSKCHRPVITKDQMELEGFLNIKKPSLRLDRLINKIKKTPFCCHENCRNENPKLKYSPSDNSFSMSYDDNNKKTIVTLTVDEIYNILDNISDEDVRLLGFKPEFAHPRNYILCNLPVLPPVDRPYVQVNGNIWDDDITVQYIEILKANEQLRQANENKLSQTDPKRQKALSTLIFRVSTTFNNSQNKAKHTTNARPIKGLKERLTGKEGQIRNNMMGKRCDHTARTVIGPDPTLRSDEIAIPKQMAETLTIPVRVTSCNITQMQKMVDEGMIDIINKGDDKKTSINIKRYRIGTRLLNEDIIHRNGETIKVDVKKHTLLPGDKLERNGKLIENIKPSNRNYPIKEGMIIHRPIKDGDIVLLNRQPTLHKGSMMAMKVLVKDHKTIRMNLAICKSFNADFDGDEMNIHVPQGLESQTELTYLSAAKYNLISAQSSKPNMAIVQDSLLGSFRMTMDKKSISKGQYFDISMHLDLREPVMKSIQRIRRVLKNKGKKVQCFNGKGIVSLFLPPDLNYEHKNNADPDEPYIKIHKGVLYEGVLDKSVLGSSHSSLIHVINKEYGPNEAMYFIDCIQFSTSQYLMIRGFTVGIGDCLVTDVSKQTDIKNVIKKCYIEADGISTTTTHPGVREIRVNGALNKAKDVGLKIAKDSLAPTNNFLSTVKSGSKGDFFNISQITGLLGQQNLKGQRVPLTMNNGKRSLPHYPLDPGKMDIDAKYESRGFIASSFIQGLNPREFYFHAMSGREGITDTAMGTATSGYMQRRIVKLTEDIKVQYDGTVRDASKRIYQLSYGDNGIDPTMTTKVNGQQEFCNVGRIIDKLMCKK